LYPFLQPVEDRDYCEGQRPIVWTTIAFEVDQSDRSSPPVTKKDTAISGVIKNVKITEMEKEINQLVS
jgi:hypothetical protein